MKTRKLRKLMARYQQSKNELSALRTELQDTIHEFQRERADMFLSLRSLDQQLQLKNFLIDVSQSSYKIYQCIDNVRVVRANSACDIIILLLESYIVYWMLYAFLGLKTFIFPGRNSYHPKNWTRSCGEFIGMRRTRLGTWSRILCHWDRYPTVVRRGFQLMASPSSPCCGPIRQLVVADPHCDNRSNHSLKVSATDTCKLHTIRAAWSEFLGKKVGGLTREVSGAG